MPTILSWNIQKLGEKKAFARGTGAPTQVFQVIATLIRHVGADIVGIMEVVGGEGQRVVDTLCAILNNPGGNPPGGAAYTWRGVVSARQDGKPMEEYVYLWKDQANVLTLDTAALVGPAFTSGVVDRQAFEGFRRRQNWTAAQIGQLLAALVASFYAVQPGYGTGGATKTRTWRVSPNRYRQLVGQGANAAVVFDGPPAAQPPAGMTLAQRQEVARILMGLDILQYISYPDRSPYVASFVVGNAPARRLTVGLLHAPRPGNPTLASAINVLGLLQPLVNTVANGGNLLLMGDFNVSAWGMNAEGRVYARGADGKAFGLVRPPQMVQVFAPITGAPLNAANVLGEVDTTVIKNYWPPNEPFPNLLANAYDKFFHHPAAAPNGLPAGAGQVVPVLPMLSSLTPAPGFHPAFARAALTFYRAYCGTARVVKDRLEVQHEADRMRDTLNYWTAQAAAAQRAAAGYGGTPPARSPLGKRKRQADDELVNARNDVAAIQVELNDIDAFRTMIANAALQAVAGSGPALNVYRDAVSDHLPIVLTVG